MRVPALNILISTAAFGGCLSFGPPPGGSRCAASSPEFKWLNPPAEKRFEDRSMRAISGEPFMDPAFFAGVAVTGGLEFELAAKGRHFVEVFLMNPEADRYPFRLEADGKLLDERPLIAPGPGRLRPKRGIRFTSLLAVVTGPRKLSVRTPAPGYLLAAARWTPFAQFEKEQVPKYRERAAFLRSNIMTEGAGQLPMARRALLQHAADRLYLSEQPGVKEEALLDRVRAWFWLTAENHEPDDILQTDRLFREALKLMPASNILRQTISASCTGQVIRVGRMPHGDYCEAVKPVPWSVEVPAPPVGAPAWAIEQRKLLRRMQAITRWWVEKRQAPNGELGGAWGDDVEILRHWGPEALGLGSAVAARGILNIAGGLWNSGTLLHGYDRGISDVEHSSEPTTDTQPLAAALHPEDPELRGRLGATAACMDYWIKQQPDGRLRFRSSWFNCREADTSAERAVDVHLNTRAAGPALWYAYLSRDEKLIRLIAGWADAWLEAMRSTSHGKPAGLFPSVVRSADGSYMIGSERWDKPQAEWDYFQWSGESQEALTSLVLAVYELTGDRRYLDAAGETFRVLENCAAHKEICDEIKDSPEAFYVWRERSGDGRYDALFGYNAKRPDADALHTMAEHARMLDKKFSNNFEMYTSEVLYTDRVYYPLTPEYRWLLFGGEAPRGDRYPTFAVTWPAAQAEFARAVLEATPEKVRLRAYSFEAGKRMALVRLWRLKPGRYTWRAGEERGEFEISRLPHLLEAPLPPRTEITVSVERAR